MAGTIFEALNEAVNTHVCAASTFLRFVGLRALVVGALPAAAISLTGAYVANQKCAAQQRTPLPGAGIPMLGGQCPVGYILTTIANYTDDRGQSGQLSNGPIGLPGPISPIYQRTTSTPGSAPFLGLYVKYGPSQLEQLMHGINGGPGFFNARYTGFGFSELRRADNLPDNCGNPPFQTYPVPDPSTPAPVIPTNPDGHPYLPGDTYNISFQPTVNFPPVFIPVTVGPIVFAPNFSFPMRFQLSIGSIQVGGAYLTISGDIVIDDKKQFDDPDRERDIDKILKEIRDCACRLPPDPPELEVLSVPVVLPEDPDCDLSFVDLLVLKGTVDPNDAIKLARSADLARQGCEQGTPQQEPESEIFSGTSTLLNHEFFSPEIPPEVYSVRLQIDSFGPAPIPVTSFPGSSQYKFGAMAWCGPLSDGSGDPVLVFDTKTYMVLPVGHPKGHVRILLKEGCSFRLFDTGERV